MKIFYCKRFIFYKINSFKEAIYIKYIRLLNHNKDFTIISNNCWGGSVYEDLGLSYTTPTVGLFFFSPCYILFLKDLKNNLTNDIEFIEHSKYEKGNFLQTLNKYPIGLINGEIEIHFLHYNDEQEARDKWIRRSKRVNFNNLFLSFSDNEVCTLDEIKAFDELPYKKVFFSAKKIENIKSLVYLKLFQGKDGVGNLYDSRWSYRKYFNVVKWLNK